MKEEIVEELFTVVLQYGARLAVQKIASGLTPKEEERMVYIKGLVDRYRKERVEG